MSRNLQLATSAQCKQDQRNLVRLILRSVFKKNVSASYTGPIIYYQISISTGYPIQPRRRLFPLLPTATGQSSGHWVVGLP